MRIRATDERMPLQGMRDMEKRDQAVMEEGWRIKWGMFGSTEKQEV